MSDFVPLLQAEGHRNSNNNSNDSYERSVPFAYTHHLLLSLETYVRKPSLSAALKENDASALKRCLGPVDLIAYGIGSTVGAGIFVVYGDVAKNTAGPAIVLSFLVAALSSLLSAFCYAEFAARVPLSGSAYTFAYLSLGEATAWFIGWNLTLEYGVAAAAVARGWSAYLVGFLVGVGADLPPWLAGEEAYFDGFIQPAPLAALIVGVCSVVLLAGVQESSTFNNVVTFVNVSLLLFIIVFGAFHVQPINWTADFAPYGAKGVFSGAGIVFFSYIGFDSVSTLSGEVKNPGRNLPIGIVGTLLITTFLYCAISLVVTGMIPFTQLNTDAPLAETFKQIGFPVVANVVAGGAVSTLAATTLCSLLGQPRIYYQMAKDGLLFHPFGMVSSRRVPVIGTLVTGVGAGVLATLFPLDSLTNVISIGTLLAFAVVCGGLIVLRYAPPSSDRSVLAQRTRRNVPLLAILLGLLSFGFSFSYKFDAPVIVIIMFGWFIVALIGYIWLFYEQQPKVGSFSCPLVPLVPGAGLFVNCYLLGQLNTMAFVRVVVWTVLGFIIYFAYGVRHSRLNFPPTHNDDVQGTDDDTEQQQQLEKEQLARVIVN
jgi:basic amino acid/polyamine antiporter, APA family